MAMSFASRSTFFRAGLTVAVLAAAVVFLRHARLQSLQPAVPGTFAACPAAHPSTRYTDAIQQARAIARELRDDLGAPGLSAAVAVDGAVVWAEAVGSADAAGTVPLTPDTPLRVHSVSKPLTAAAVGLLVEQGRLDLDAPIQRYVPQFPDKGAPITVRLLGGHLAGIRHYTSDAEVLSRRAFPSIAATLPVFAADSLLFPPGARFSYSSYGWVLVGAAIEGASGEQYLAVMRRRVFEPLGMTHSGPDRPDSSSPGRVRYYEHTDAGLVEAPYVDLSNRWPSGGLASTPTDLVRFGSALLCGALLRPETVALLFTAQHTGDGTPTGYGIGWELGSGVVYHRGGSIGGVALLVLFREHKVAPAVAANVNGRPPSSADPRDLAGPFIAARRAAR